MPYILSFFKKQDIIVQRWPGTEKCKPCWKWQQTIVNNAGVAINAAAGRTELVAVCYCAIQLRRSSQRNGVERVPDNKGTVCSEKKISSNWELMKYISKPSTTLLDKTQNSFWVWVEHHSTVYLNFWWNLYQLYTFSDFKNPKFIWTKRWNMDERNSWSIPKINVCQKYANSFRIT